MKAIKSNSLSSRLRPLLRSHGALAMIVPLLLMMGSSSFAQVPTVGFLTNDRYEGKSRSDLEAPDFAATPDRTTYLRSFAVDDPANTDFTESVYGWFKPKVTGNYVFFVSSNDDSDLFLSTDDKPENLKLIAAETNWSGKRNYLSSPGNSDLMAKRSDQFAGSEWPTPNVITLTAGRRYYIRGVHHFPKCCGNTFTATFKLEGEADPADGSPSTLTGDLIETLKPDLGVVITINTQPADVTKLAGEVASFTVTATATQTGGATPTISYQWQKEAPGEASFADIPGATSNTFMTAPLTSADNGAKYHVVVSSNGKSVTSRDALLTLGTVSPPNARFDDTKTQVALPIDTPPVIDGIIDANEWGQGTRWRVTVDPNTSDAIRTGALALGTAPEDSDDLSFQIFARYDTKNLYVAVQVRDSSIQTDSADADSANGNTWEDDSVEVFVDGLNANDPAWAAGQLGGQFVITANNAYRENEAGNPGFGTEAAWHARTTLRPDGSGYDAKFRISLATLGNPKPGDVVGFTVAVNDDDDGTGRERQVVWVGTAHQPVTYGNLVLGGKSYSAPKASAPTIDGVINPAEYAGATEIKVDRFSGIYDPGSGDDTWESADLSYSGWVVHDAEAIYVAVAVTDDNVVNDTAEVGSEDGTTWEDDSVEIFFDADHTHDAGRGTGPFEGQYVFTANGAWRDNEANNPTFGASGDWFAATSKTAKGYQVEYKVKKSALFNPPDGSTLGFHIAVNDDDGSGRKAQLGWSGHAHNEYTYGHLKLIGAVQPAVTVTAKLVGGKVEITWSGGGVLETRASFSVGSWAPVPGAASGIQIDLTTAAAGFYRVRL
ncbi:MAG: hypothetical protein L0Z50_36685 [Verrucomicrobiales bacterium]|nr:hypothetical protein [Verrucomicrobiales bacterium]